ncbi:MAG TPA: pilus assembly protein [Paenibacillus sp.]|uniref:pilus assembly protein n=1 Tax=Paenibacillus sp. TaxID=58172 RepID=UPI002BDF0D6F|nr:pilus assembly protein [Paenibacillus sp.]HUC91583.1 pilus assembly protein [Paenibacillus sp.]
MSKRIKYSIDRAAGRRIWRDERGSAVLESSAVFPLVFISVLLLMLMSLLVYERVVLYYSASAAAERAAFRWDNSSRDPVTGMAPEGRYDGLYWRLGDDDMPEGIFGSFAGDRSGGYLALPVPQADAAAVDSLPVRKMKPSAGRIAFTYRGEMAYERKPLLRRVAVSLSSSVVIGQIVRLTGRSESRVKASAVIVDPVEFIRNVDLARYYAAKFGSGRAGAGKRAKAAAILNERKPGGAPGAER